MPSNSAAATAAPPAPPTDVQQFAELLRRVEAGQDVDPREVMPLTQASDRGTRGLAKRLLAVMLTEQARRDATRLLCEACEELEFRHPALLGEALSHLRAVGQADQVFAFQARAAEYAVHRHDHVTALLHVQAAAATDFQLGGRCISSPECLRSLIGVYERVAQESASSAGIQPAPRRQRRSPADGKLRLAHVVCQLVDGGHSPSRVTRTMLDFADRQRFDNYVVVTEALARHAEQPGQAIMSETSDRRAPGLIAHFERELGAPVLRPRSLSSFLTAAADLHRQVAEHQIDVTFFHGSIATPTDWLLCAWQAAPWQFDRGFGTPLYCPALDYQFFELQQTMEPLAFLCRERGVPYGLSPNGSVDLSNVERAAPFPRDALGIPSDHVVLGTVGNHLSKRMSPAFCRTVAGVLRAHPKTTYLVVGPGPFERQPGDFGSDLVGDNGPGARVRFVGPTNEADRWTLTFDIYVNEYPGGGGISVCEAMAAAKPVVCIQADQSALSVVGAVFVGEENLVRPATDQAYARRLAELIANPAQRQALGRALRERYQQEFDPRQFVAKMTERIWEVVHDSRDTE